MKILLLDTYYPQYLKRFYSTHAAPEAYDSGLKALLASRFGTSDFYSRHLQAAGADATDYVLNDLALQSLWALDRGLETPSFAARALRRIWPSLGPHPFFERCALAQIREAKPDVAYVQDTGWFSPQALREIKAMGAFLVGQIACPMPIAEKMREFDLIVTSFPHFVPRLRDRGQSTEYLKLAFEPDVLRDVGPRKRTYDAVFVGGLNGHHRPGVAILEQAAKRTPIDVWGYGAEDLAPDSPLRRRFHGEAWALDMFAALGQARIAVNRHIDVAENFANNMRLFEATGMGAMLVTDMKDNLSDLFAIGKEVVAYRDGRDLAEKLAHFAAHPEEARAIAEAGQKRTLSEHTYAARMVELKAILEKHLRRSTRKASMQLESHEDSRVAASDGRRSNAPDARARTNLNEGGAP